MFFLGVFRFGVRLGMAVWPRMLARIDVLNVLKCAAIRCCSILLIALRYY